MAVPSCVLLGTPAFAIPLAEVVQRSSACALRGIITMPDEPTGRARALTPPPLAAWAKGHGVPCWQPKTKVGLVETIRELIPDVAIIAAYGRIIPGEALAVPRFGFVNIHPSLLPHHRGPSPIQTAIASGDTETGVTLMLLDAQVDHGPILAQERIPLSPTATSLALERKLAVLGAQLLARTLPDYLAGRTTPTPQDHARATTTPLLTREHGRLDWRRSAMELDRMVRAYEGWPGTWCLLADEKRLKVLSAVIGTPSEAILGTILTGDGAFRVACAGGTSLTLTSVQPEGGAPMDGAAFLRGYRGPRLLSSA